MLDTNQPLARDVTNNFEKYNPQANETLVRLNTEMSPKSQDAIVNYRTQHTSCASAF
jgi:hypothetical protein